MALPASGAIRLSQVNTNMGLASNTYISLGGVSTRKIAELPTSGTVLMSNLHGKSYALSIKLAASTPGVVGDNYYYYDQISAKTLIIASGDKLVYDCWVSGPTTAGLQIGVDGDIIMPTFTDVLRHKGLVDQNGLGLHPAIALNQYARNKWYHREFSLSSLAGGQVNRWWVAYEDETAGDYVSYYKNIYILDSNRNIKLTIFNGSLEITSLTPIHIAGYNNITKSVVFA
jgi:hypothetical protein